MYICILTYIWGIPDEDHVNRANDVRSVNAPAVSTTSAHRTSSAANKQRHVLFVNRNGLVNTLWANGPSLLLIGRQPHGGGVDVRRKELKVLAIKMVVRMMVMMVVRWRTSLDEVTRHLS